MAICLPLSPEKWLSLQNVPHFLAFPFCSKQFLAFSASKDMAQEYMAKPATQQLGGGNRQLQVHFNILLSISTQKT